MNNTDNNNIKINLPAVSYRQYLMRHVGAAVNVAIAITFLSIGMIIGFAVCAMLVAGDETARP